jgi:hypothetical protein
MDVATGEIDDRDLSGGGRSGRRAQQDDLPRRIQLDVAGR